MTEQEELNYLRQNSPASLPDDPSSSGWSTAQIKAKFYDGLFFLYNLFKQNRTNLTGAVSDMQSIVNTINEAYEDILTGETVKAKYDEDNNVIKTTYAKILNITNGTISVLKYIKENGTDTDFVYNIEKNLTTLTTAFNTLKVWTDNLKSTTSEESVLRAVQATKDSLGNVIKDTYATVTSVSLLNNAITNIINGTTIVDKAYKDMDGNRIDTTYVKIANIVNALNDTSTNKPLSAAQGKALKDMIDAINTLLASDDTSLDQLQEIVSYIKNNKSLIDGITISKMAFTDLVKNLTTNNDNLPLAASQGYALKAMIDAINDAENGIQAAEALRVIAEAGRVEAEEARQTGYSGFDSRITANTNAISGIKDGANIDSFSDVESALSDKADSSDVYDKTEVYTKAEAEALINAKCKETADNLRWELGTYDLGVESDNTSALVKTMPSGTIKLNVNKIYGDSEVSENLANPDNTNILNNTSNNYAIVIKITNLNLEYGKNYRLSFDVTGSTYSGSDRFRYYINNDNYYSYNGIDDAYSNGRKTLNIILKQNARTLEIRFSNNAVSGNMSGVITNVMLNEGSSALPYSPYYTGIHNLELSGLKVEGSNKFNSEIENGVFSSSDGTLVNSQNRIRSKDYTQLKAGTYSISWTTSLNLIVYVWDLNDNYLLDESIINWTSATTNYSFTLTSERKVKFAWKYNDNRNLTPSDISNVMLNRGSTALDYVSYVAPTTKTIDLSTILYNGNPLFEDNSLKKVSTSVDYLTPYKAYKGAKQIVFDGSDDENWIMATSLDNRFLIQNFWADYGVDYSDCVNSYHYNYQPSLSGNYGYICRNGGQFIVNLANSSVLNLDQWKAYLQNNPLIVIFPLATPIEVSIDWSATLRNIQGYPNGSITAQNTHNMDVPSDIDYLIEEVKA